MKLRAQCGMGKSCVFASPPDASSFLPDGGVSHLPNQNILEMTGVNISAVHGIPPACCHSPDARRPYIDTIAKSKCREGSNQ